MDNRFWESGRGDRVLGLCAKMNKNQEILKKMTATQSAVNVVMSLSQTTYDQIQKMAIANHQKTEELLTNLITEGLDAQSTTRQILERISKEYRDRLSQEGTLDQSSEKTIQSLRELRENIVNELYP